MTPPKKSGNDGVPPGLANLFGEHEPIASGTPSQQAQALRLDPLDNQLARVNLVSWMIEVGDDERAGQFFEAYPDTPSSSWRYSRALWLYRAEGPSPLALEVLVEAMVMNPGTFVALATNALPFDIDSLGPGMLLEIESASYYTTASLAWIESEGALDWLASLVESDTGSDLPGIPELSGLASQRGRRQMGRTDKSPATRSPKAAKLLQIKVSLRRAPKPIWRRLLVEKSTTLADLHDIIQIAMGWDSGHLFEFRAGKKRFIVPDDGRAMGADDAQVAKLSDSLNKPEDRMLYIYDYGDSWEHDVVLEKLVGHKAGLKYPRCVRGARACPPEDCGGTDDFADLVAALADPLHPSHEYARDRLGPDYDPRAFDLDAVNRRLEARSDEGDLDDIEPNPWF